MDPGMEGSAGGSGAAPFLLRPYLCSRPENAANFVAVSMTAYAVALGSAENGVLTFEKR